MSQDFRFSDHPIVTTVGARFYASALLRSPSGHALGTFCICDTRPRILCPEERLKLLALAKGVSSVLELHRTGVQLLNAANRDTLTGLSSRRFYDELLGLAVEKAQTGSPFALMFIDLDGFKSINDTWGHAAGDAVLCEVARRLQATATGSDRVARLAGDEFTLMIADDISRESLVKRAARLLEALRAPFSHDDQNLPIQASIGIALCPEHAGTAAELQRCADLALYDAKRAGRNTFRILPQRDTDADPVPPHPGPLLAGLGFSTPELASLQLVTNRDGV